MYKWKRGFPKFHKMPFGNLKVEKEHQKDSQYGGGQVHPTYYHFRTPTGTRELSYTLQNALEQR